MEKKPVKKEEKFKSNKSEVGKKVTTNKTLSTTNKTLSTTNKTSNTSKNSTITFNNLKKSKKKVKLGLTSIILGMLMIALISIWYLLPLKVYFIYIDESLLEYDTDEKNISLSYFDYYASLKAGESIGDNFPLIEDFFDDSTSFSIRWFDKDGNEYNNDSKAYLDFNQDLELYAYLFEDVLEKVDLVEIPNNLNTYPSYSGNYYSNLESINISSLRELLTSGFIKHSYNEAGKGAILIEADTPYKEDYVLGIYDGTHFERDWKNGTNFEREHVWCNSRLGMDRVTSSGKNQASDLHNLRAIGGVHSTTINQKRSDRYFVNDELNPYIGHTVGTNAFYPGANDKGDVARILLYMYVMYDFLKLESNLNVLNNYSPYQMSSAAIGDLSVLLAWNIEDPVDDFERHRNDIIYNYQHNRNPFIDHPEYFSIILSEI
ncbi:MAG: endonuclease [Acholeplasmatales bacterium]|jgi:endonuclease I|nr:endonuclease [Acholeplasmatales bacterium]